MKKRKIRFGRVYLLYVILLVIAMIAAIIHVYRLLNRYEAMRPETHIESAMEMLADQAVSGDFFVTYALEDAVPGKFEQSSDVKKQYLGYYQKDAMEFVQKSGGHEEDELFYLIKNNDLELAEVKLKAVGPTVTKLAVLNFREWDTEYIKPFFGAKDYTISVPNDFEVKVNGILLNEQDGTMNGEDEINYTVKGIYLNPDFDIKDQDGQNVSYQVKDGEVITEFYHYALTLPLGLSVKVNGKSLEGESVDANRVKYSIRSLEKPEVEISDCFGNSISYEGESEVPMTYYTVKADSRYQVAVDGVAAPQEIVNTYENKEYEPLKDYVQNLPQISEYSIAVLKSDAVLSVKDEAGAEVKLEQGKSAYDFIENRNGVSQIPEEVSSDLDILAFAQEWSLFMSNDSAFSKIQPRLIKDSYQYKVALQYATGIDITFTSNHRLGNPAFTENEVSNFIWITDECFAVDVHFVKHMILGNGTAVDDTMNDRFYFVKYGADGAKPTYRMIGMKEIVNNGK